NTHLNQIKSDIWSEVLIELDALRSDARHQEHLAVGLAVKEGQRLFARALQLQLPHLLVSTTDIERARDFYAPSAAPNAVPRAWGAHVTQDAARPEAIADRLSGWLCGWLGLDEIDPAVSLYDHGVDSLTMLDLVAKVEQHYGVVLELSQLGHRISLNGVLALAEAAGPGAAPPADQVPLDVWQEGTGSDVVCLIHPVGGDVQAYRALVSALDPHLTVCLIADPALRSPDRPSWSLAERARHYHAALRARFPHGPWRWHLAGWSFGAWVAHAVAAEAEAAGHPAAGLHLLDPPPPDAAPHFLAYDEARYAAVFAHELSQGGTGQDSTDGGRTGTGPSPEALAYAERLARCCRANVAAMAHHQPPRLTRTPSRLWLATRPVDGLPVLGSPEEQRRLWEERLPLLDGFHELDTTHYGVVRTPWVRAVADAVNTATGTAAEPR
ncbi:thioesterase domain-containing protein, partial [Streptomyces violascens]|uniref:thioesterase domain-containing protein n=1 Tax=Streptomyces violascens TaxID=67381 RepID=UPI0036C4070C